MSDQRETNRSDQIFCMHCGTAGTVGMYACVRCGERLYLPDPERPPPLGYIGCPSCGAANESHASYCASCQSEFGIGERVSPTAHADGGYDDLRSSAARGSGESADAFSGIAVIDDSESEDAKLSDSRGGSKGEDAPLPSELRGWNWPAFLLGPIWGVGHRIWWTAIGFLALAPLINAGPRQAALLIWLAMMLFLGFRGNELAWRARRWESVDKFMAAQQRWGIWAVVAVAALVAGLIVYMYVQ